MPVALLGTFAPYVVSAIREVWPKRKPKVGEDHYAEQLHRTLARVGVVIDRWDRRVRAGRGQPR